MSQKRFARVNNSSEATKLGAEKTHYLYEAFDQLDGQHPWRDQMPEGFLPYSARYLPEGQVAYFNFALAKEMGLIAADHPYELTPELKKKLIETFSLRIINEYDAANGINYPAKRLKKSTYMATRYLQLQHSSRNGKTSGDGRCIWNGVYNNNGILWDVSSRGVGVTALAPGSVDAGKPLQSGSTDFGYGCGMAELDELYSATIMAEIFHNQGINTERMLTVIDIGNGLGIGVRAGKNLIRPAHLFLYLKQNDHEALKRSVDYLIIRQHRNGEWKFGIHSPQRYKLMLKELISQFAQFVATLDRQYIFAWLDWDGDNVLASAGIIDYGSVRQFGIRHDQYRYDDVERLSTTLNQQIPKARLMMQVFVQIVDFLDTGKKRPLPEFAKHSALRLFDRLVEKNLRSEFVRQLGFPEKETNLLLNKYKRDVEKLFKTFSSLERAKISRPTEKVADGINRPAVFNMKNVVRDLVMFFNDHSFNLAEAKYPIPELFQSMLSDHASRKDSKLSPSVKKRLNNLQNEYRRLIEIVCRRSKRPSENLVKDICNRANIINREDKITGNALIHIVFEIMDSRKKGLSHSEVQLVMDEFIRTQSISPENKDPILEPQVTGKASRLMRSFLTLIEGHKEDI